MTEDTDVIDFARSQHTSTLGKCTAEAKTLLPESVKEQLTALAVLNGQSLSEYLRDMCIEHTHGHVFMLQMRAGKGNGRNQAGSGQI